MNRTLHVGTYNIHKGFSAFNRRLVIHELRDHLRALKADLLFLQEVQGGHDRHAKKFENWPAQPQHEFLADSNWTDFAYGRNAVYDAGHHGNAILSRFPIARWDNEDISEHRYEHRGMLHCEIAPPGWDQALHCVCVHLGLLARHRNRQLRAVRERIERVVPPDAPLVIAGDFNDWRRHAHVELAQPLGLKEVFEHANGGLPARSFPSNKPMFCLDRIYVRGFDIKNARVHHGHTWARISDHAALTACIVRA
jgi:endonuclease/exonuclease/phosphatase family metal-dependent hydrolase